MKLKKLYIISATILYGTIVLYSCKSSEVVASKIGAQLWGENCIRCHYTPSPTEYSDDQWELIGTHMRVRANLTATETDKIVEFLQMAN